MEEKKYNETIVVGGGPSGTAAARKIAQKNNKTLILEEDRCIGSPIQCAGIVSTRTIETTKIPEKQRKPFILNKVRGAYINSPDGRRIKISREEPQAVIIDRQKFDQKMMESALEKGAELKTGWRATDWDGNKLKVRTPQRNLEIKPKLVLGADGVKSTVRRSYGLPSPEKTLSGAQVTITDIDVKDTDYVELFLGRNIAPGFFAWAIPIDKETARLGLCVDPSLSEKPAVEYLKKLPENHSAAKKYNGKEIEWNYGAIPIGPPDKLTGEKTIILGDAAGQVKPTTGGGVYTGLTCGEIAGETVNKYIAGETQLKTYEKKWREKLGRELKLGMAIHKSLCSLKNRELNKINKKFDNPEITRLIENHGDMDYPSKLGFKLLKKQPSLLKYFGLFGRKLFGELI